ncbi:hypothetical protein A2614_01985 [Candidatus Woesebacteria bacterium RIFOXYD1_FULL_40_21]|uniref:26 kDa periplasmic immunogenic protein n=1 Tax=Candidatus Woesebacteria bacterium RIFOXYD1_FULL_40_21 TaxID=1802549 RepID=A0A1F8DIH2_9BACT|nr:MAG: hypothetical protein A2614_01985 [Candidatus Woesebacteria bacterium RIFOXYD1_FULL_40_21]
METQNILKHPLTLLISFFVLLFLFTKFGPNLPVSILSQEKGQPLVVQGEGKVSVVPDIAKVSLGIEESGSSLKTVQDSVNKKSKTLTDELKKLGIKDADIKTVSYNVSPNYDYRSVPTKIIGYRVSTTYEVKIKDFDKVNDVLVKATEVGANSIGNVSFEVNEETKKEKLQDARKEAVKEAKDKAEGLAKAAGITLGKIINISEQQGFDNTRPIPLLEKSGIGGDTQIAQPEIAPGETELSVIVSLSFELR